MISKLHALFHEIAILSYWLKKNNKKKENVLHFDCIIKFNREVAVWILMLHCYVWSKLAAFRFSLKSLRGKVKTFKIEKKQTIVSKHQWS